MHFLIKLLVWSFSVEMYYSSVLLLLSLFVAAVTSQTAECNAAQAALVANTDCYNVYTDIAFAINNDRTVSMLDLNVYCVPDCRNLVNRLITCDGDPESEAGVRFNEYLCNVDSDGVSCYDFIRSPRFDTLANSVDAVCPNIPAGQTCSSTCQTAFQNFVVDGGCCIQELFEFASQDADDELNNLLAQCPVDLSRGGTCTEIGGGATGLKAVGSVLFLAVIIAVTGY